MNLHCVTVDQINYIIVVSTSFGIVWKPSPAAWLIDHCWNAIWKWHEKGKSNTDTVWATSWSLGLAGRGGDVSYHPCSLFALHWPHQVWLSTKNGGWWAWASPLCHLQVRWAGLLCSSLGDSVPTSIQVQNLERGVGIHVDDGHNQRSICPAVSEHGEAANKV